MVYVLGAVKPHVRSAADTVGKQFRVTNVLGVGIRPSGNSDHPRGLALDYMTSSKQQGDAIAAYVQQHASLLGVTYVIWYRRIWHISRASQGWRTMPDRGSNTANHYDHVHVSFTANPGANVQVVSDGGIVEKVLPNIPGLEGAVNTASIIAGLTQIILWLANPKNWLRIAIFLSGLSLVLFSVWRLMGTPTLPKLRSA